MKQHSKKERYDILAFNWQDVTHPQSGGAEVHFHEIFKRLAGRGHCVTLACCKYAGAKKAEMLDGIHIRRYGNRNMFNYSVPFAYRELRKKGVDIVFDDINKIPFYTPCFVREPICAIVHHLFAKSIYLETNWLSASYVYVSEKLIPFVYRETPVAAVSQSTIDELQRKGMQGPVFLLPNAVDLRQFRAGEMQPEPLIGYFGRLKKYKSVEHFIKAIPLIKKQLPAARFVVLGGGDYQQKLENLARELGVESSVIFTGYVGHSKKIEWLQRMWCAVNPSPKEGWGLTVIEANACGTPVVAADSAGLRDSVVDQETGFLYPYGDIKALADKVILLCNQSERLLQIKARALKWAAKFDWDRSADLALHIIENILNKTK